MTLLPTLCLTHFFHTNWIGCASMGKMMYILMDLCSVSASTWCNAWWNDMQIVFLQEPQELWHCFQLCASLISSTQAESVVLAWVRRCAYSWSWICGTYLHQHGAMPGETTCLRTIRHDRVGVHHSIDLDCFFIALQMNLDHAGLMWNGAVAMILLIL